MKITSLKKSLLVGSALVAVGALGAGSAHADPAVQEQVTSDSSTTWSARADSVTGSEADTLIFDGADTITVGDGEDIGDGDVAPGTGASVDADGNSGVLVFDGGDGDASDATGSIVYGDILANGGDVTIEVGTAGNNAAAVSFYGDVEAGNDLDVLGTGTNVLTFGNGTDAMDFAATQEWADAAGTLTVNLNEGATLSGAIVASTAGATITVNVDGNSAITGAVDLDSGVDVIVDDGVTLTVSDDFDITATGQITLGDAATTDATLLLNGAGAQTITGLIDGDADGNGVISVTNTGGLVTFANNIGATFDVGTLSLGADADVLASGQLNVNTITLAADSTLEQDAAAVATTITVADGATLNSDSTIAATTITIAEGGTVLQGAGAITSAIVNDGTLTLDGAGGVVGDITGTGLLDVDASAAIDGAITQGTADIAAFTLTQTSADGYSVGTTNFSAAGTLALAAGDQTIAGNFTNTTAGQGTITLADGAGTTAFTGNLGESATDALLALTLAGGGTAQTVTTTGDVFVATTTLGTDDTLQFIGSTQTVDGNIRGIGAGQGLVVVGNGTDATNVTFNDAIGAAAALQGFSVALGSTANISNNVTVTSGTAGAINIDGTLNVDVTTGSATLDNTGAGAMALDGTVNVTGDGTGAFTLGSGGTIHAGWNDTAATLNAGDTVLLADTFIVGGGATIEGDIYTINAVFRDTDGVDDDGFDPTAATIINANNQIVSVNTAGADAGGAVLQLGLGGLSSEAANALLLDGTEVVQFIDDANAASDLDAELDNGEIVFVDTAFIDLTTNVAGTDDTSIAATLNLKSTAEALGGNTTYAGAAGSLAALGVADRTGTLATARANMLMASSSAEASEVAESVSPTVDGGAVVAGFAASDLSLDLNTTRLASLRDGETGMAAGNMGHGMSTWIQGFGKTAEQDARDGVDGYEADTYGVAIGLDSANHMEDAVLGLALSYANSDVDSDNANSTESDIDSYQVSLYGDMDLDDATYVAGSLGFAWNEIDQTRYNVGGVGGPTATSDYDSQQYMVSAELGRKYAVGQSIVTPFVGVDYQHIAIDDYQESGAGTANLNVDNDDLNILQLGIGANVKWNLAQNNGSTIVPALHAGYKYDVLDEEVETTSNFTGGGASFSTDGADPAQSTFNVGGSVTLFSADQWNLTGAYDFEYKEDYDAHSGYIRAGYNF